MVISLSNKLGFITKKQMMLCAWILLFVFQDLLCKFSSIFSYIDEAPLLIWIGLCFYKILRNKRLDIKDSEKTFFIVLIAFVLFGLVGNILYHYQPIKLVIIDLLTNIKFFGAIFLFEEISMLEDSSEKKCAECGKILTLILFMIFVVDRIFNIYPAEYRYGIKSAVLFYSHPTYFAGVCAFLISLMTISSPNKYKYFILLDVIMIMFTLRSKAFMSAFAFVILYIVIIKLRVKLELWQLAVLGVIAVCIAWPQINFYFIQLGGHSARSVMLLTSFQILKDYFPFGTGFATYASHSAAVNYSPVYTKYGFELIYELRNSAQGTFFDDQFWPIIFGQTGFLGSICYVYILGHLICKIQKVFKYNLKDYMIGFFIIIYLLISSIAEPAFNNSVAIPMAMVMGMIFGRKKKLVKR